MKTHHLWIVLVVLVLADLALGVLAFQIWMRTPLGPPLDLETAHQVTTGLQREYTIFWLCVGGVFWLPFVAALVVLIDIDLQLHRRVPA